MASLHCFGRLNNACQCINLSTAPTVLGFNTQQQHSWKKPTGKVTNWDCKVTVAPAIVCTGSIDLNQCDVCIRVVIPRDVIFAVPVSKAMFSLVVVINAIITVKINENVIIISLQHLFWPFRTLQTCVRLLHLLPTCLLIYSVELNIYPLGSKHMITGAWTLVKRSSIVNCFRMHALWCELMTSLGSSLLTMVFDALMNFASYQHSWVFSRTGSQQVTSLALMTMCKLFLTAPMGRSWLMSLVPRDRRRDAALRSVVSLLLFVRDLEVHSQHCPRVSCCTVVTCTAGSLLAATKTHAAAICAAICYLLLVWDHFKFTLPAEIKASSLSAHYAPCQWTVRSVVNTTEPHCSHSCAKDTRMYNIASFMACSEHSRQCTVNNTYLGVMCSPCFNEVAPFFSH